MNWKIWARIQWPLTECKMHYFGKSQELISEVQNCIQARDHSASRYLNKPHGTVRASLEWAHGGKTRATCLEWPTSYREEVLPWQQERFLPIFLVLISRRRGYCQKKAECLPINCAWLLCQWYEHHRLGQKNQFSASWHGLALFLLEVNCHDIK